MSGASDDNIFTRGLKDIFTGGANEFIPGVHSLISGPSNAEKGAAAQQHKNFQDAIAAYAAQRTKEDDARLLAMRQSMTAMQPVNDVLQRMYGHGLNMTPPPMPAGMGTPPPSAVGPNGITAAAAMTNHGATADGKIGAWGAAKSLNDFQGGVTPAAQPSPPPPLAWGGPLGMR